MKAKGILLQCQRTTKPLALIRWFWRRVKP
ncbi:hypothetical protein ACNKHX_08965 [Shigella flexneri]